MHRPDRFVPIVDITKETKSLVVLESPPPYRQNLKIDVEALTGILGLAGSSEDQVKLGFQRRQEIVHVLPSDKGQFLVATKSTQFKEENGRELKRVSYDSRRQELKLAIYYLDEEAKTPKATAKNLSRKLSKALSVVPAEKYITNFIEDLDGGSDGTSVSGRAAELAMFAARITANILGAPITYGILSAVSNAPRPLESIGILAVVNMVDAVNDLRLAMDLLNGKSVDEKKVWMARTIAEKPLRAIYPVSLVHELLLPTAKILADDILTSAQLLKSSGE